MKFLLNHIQTPGYPSLCTSSFSFSTETSKLNKPPERPGGFASSEQTPRTGEINLWNGLYTLHPKGTRRASLETPAGNITAERNYTHSGGLTVLEPEPNCYIGCDDTLDKVCRLNIINFVL